MKKPKPGDSNSSSGNQEKLGVPTAMQPWSCEERRSGFRIKKRKKETQNSAAQRLRGWEKQTQTIKKKKKARVKIKFQKIYIIHRSEYFMRLLFLMFLGLLASPPPPKSLLSPNATVHECRVTKAFAPKC